MGIYKNKSFEELRHEDYKIDNENGTTILFGQQQQRPAAGGLFNTSSTFGQQNKPAAFGFGTQPAQPTLFGQQAAQPQTSGMFQRSTEFGTTTTSTPNPFGTGQLFGKPAAGFGSPSTATFGQPATTSLFPSSQAQPNNLFQNAGTGFGTPASTPSTGFGTTTLFGQQQQPAAGGLFNTSSTFGQQNKPAAFCFGTQPAQPTLFGQQAAQPKTSGMFQPSTKNLFGTTSAFEQESIGTGGCGTTTAAEPNPFGTGQLVGKPASGFGSPSTSAFGQPVTSSLFPSSQVQPNNLFQNAGNCFEIPASTPSTGFGTTTLFGQQQQPAAGGLFNTSSTFGQQNNQAAFGFGTQPAQPTLFNQQATQPQTSGMFQRSTGFGTSTSSTSNLFESGQLFGKPASEFGSPSTSAFGQPATTSLFPSSQAQPNNLFQNAVTGFGTPASTPSTGFGTTTLFGQQQPAAGGLFNTSSTFGHQNNQAAIGFGTQPAQPTLFSQQATQPQTSGMFQRSTGFGTTTAAAPNPFGTGQLFGKPAGGFGSPSTSAFGQPATTSLFPSSQAQPNNLFQNAGTGFGTPASTPSTGFGTNTLFGQEQQPAAGGHFNTSSTFDQQNKPAAFGFGTRPAQPTLFGQQAAQPQTSGMLQPSTSNLFGTTSAFGQQSTGTGSVKFNDIRGTDTMIQNGVDKCVNTKLQTINYMKDYESKSLEELRYEYYAANRKGFSTSISLSSLNFGFGSNTNLEETNDAFGAPQPEAFSSVTPSTSGINTATTQQYGINTELGLFGQKNTQKKNSKAPKKKTERKGAQKFKNIKKKTIPKKKDQKFHEMVKKVQNILSKRFCVICNEKHNLRLSGIKRHIQVVHRPHMYHIKPTHDKILYLQ
uniref:Nuclear pore complex protein Nup98-Nup96 n=1 Tax=Diabrotica virgifera virgifera TaxID=50390 RepID=A0A6P7GB33_DIAVI